VSLRKTNEQSESDTARAVHGESHRESGTRQQRCATRNVNDETETTTVNRI